MRSYEMLLNDRFDFALLLVVGGLILYKVEFGFIVFTFSIVPHLFDYQFLYYLFNLFAFSIGPARGFGR